MRCFLDMDGVLVDYYAGVCRVFGFNPWPYICRPGDWDFYNDAPLHQSPDLVAPHMGYEFYADLDWLPDGKHIVQQAEEVFGAENVYLLSSPWDTDGCDAGKRAWIKKHLPAYQRRALIGSCKEACAFPASVLFDDSEENLKKFQKAGGQGVLVPRPWNRLQDHADHSSGAVKGRMLADVFQFYWDRDQFVRGLRGDQTRKSFFGWAEVGYAVTDAKGVPDELAKDEVG